ncbi:hypothetical protein MMC30_006577 [Trapelia coarctata]|nr:hypothetical protein [Trapelia coarctata]
MRESRRRASYGANIDRYDMGNGRDVEKDHEFDRRTPSPDSDHDSHSYSTSSRASPGSQQPMLGKRPARKMRSFYLYRLPNRTVRWLCLALMSSVILFIFSLIHMSWVSSKQLESTSFKDKPPPPPPWEKFDFLVRYFGGVRTLVPRHQNVPEYPNDSEPKQVADTNRTSLTTRALQPSSPYNPYPDYASAAYKLEYGSVAECFLDTEDTTRIPKVHSYTGVPQGQPDPIMGSYEAVGLDNTMCFERYGRLGPYGYGYSLRRGGIGAGLTGEREGAEEVWKVDQEVDYANVRWSDAQARCLEKNKHRFKESHGVSGDAFRDMRVERADIPDSNGQVQPTGDVVAKNITTTKLLPRTAVVIRTWWDFSYTQEDVLYLRSIMTELSLLSGGEYTIHFLIHVKDDNLPIWADPETYNRTLEKAIPKEFYGMATLWSERQMGLVYGGLAESYYRDLPVHGVYRSAHMPLQYFAHKHPEYDYFWNWEMDVRYTGHWYHLFDTVSKWAKAQPRKGLWERNGRFYIPSVHGSWEDFKQMARVQSAMVPQTPNNNVWAGTKPKGPPPAPGQAPPTPPKPDLPVWGPLPPPDVPFEGRSPVAETDDPIPLTTYEKDKYVWGVDEEADLITFNPIFDPAGTTWLLAEDVTGYNTTLGSPPRRSAIITASRLSARLLRTMHTEVALRRHTMVSEMWPASVALHHGLKAVYVPHPVFIDRKWPLQYLNSVFNAGKNGASGGSRTSVFGDREHNFRGTSWYYNAGFAPNLWRRWLGYRVDGDGGEEEEAAGEGRICLPGMLLHPVKGVELVVEGVRDGER